MSGWPDKKPIFIHMKDSSLRRTFIIDDNVLAFS